MNLGLLFQERLQRRSRYLLAPAYAAQGAPEFPFDLPLDGRKP